MEILDLKVLRGYLPPTTCLFPYHNTESLPYPDSLDSDTDSDITMVNAPDIMSSPTRNVHFMKLPVTPKAKVRQRPLDYTPRPEWHSIPNPSAWEAHGGSPGLPVSAPNLNTPFKSSMHHAVVKDKGVKDPDVQNFIRAEFKGCIKRDYPIVDFVTKAWNFHPSLIPSGHDYTLNGDLCRAYLASARYVKEPVSGNRIKLEGRSETRACHIFERLFAATADMVKAAGEKHERDSDWYKSYYKARFSGDMKFLNEAIVKGDYARFKPDFGFATMEGEDRDDDAVAWISLGVVAELKKIHVQTESGIIGNVEIDLGKLLPGIEKPYDPSGKSKANGRKRGRPDSSFGVQEPPSKYPRTRRTANESTRDRNPQEAPNTVQAEPDQEMTYNEIREAKYLNELLSHGVRNYATGYLVEDRLITLWYADRFGIVKTRPFDIFLQPQYFLLMVAALTYATYEDLGFCPLISDIPRDHLSYDEATLKIPSARDVRNIERGDLYFDLNVGGGKEIITRYGTVGRGTTVIPIHAVDDALDVCGSEKLVAKLSWQPVQRDEAGNIRKIRTKLANSWNFLGFGQAARDALNYIVDFKCSASLSINDANLPRAFMYQLSDMAAEDLRDLRVLVMKEYLPLELIETADELKIIFRHALTGHHWAWRKVKILHRDISITNIMFYRIQNGVVGVLCDWDLSESAEHIGKETPLGMDEDAYRSVEKLFGVPKLTEGVKFPFAPTNIQATPVDPEDEDEETHKRKARFRTGTGPFMAMELLKAGKAPTHLYRYDLESFFWVLVYFIAVHNPEKHTLGRIDQWADPSLAVVFGKKIEFLTDPDTKIEIMSKMHSRYMPIHSTTLLKLGKLFNVLKTDNSNFNDYRTSFMEAKVVKNRREEKYWASQLVAICKKRNDLITYDKFMEYLE